MAIDNDAGASSLPSSTALALDRTLLAYDRTLMAWVRTATSLISLGFTIYKFFQYLREQRRCETWR
jgi:putative membrane protein